MEGRQVTPRNQHLDRPSLARSPSDEVPALEREDHVVHRRRRDIEVPLEVRFGRRAPVDLRVGRNERQVLPLKFGEPWVCQSRLPSDSAAC